MPFISASDGLIKKSVTSIENKFITKYLPDLDPIAVKVYLYAMFLWQSGSQYNIEDLSKSLNIAEDELKNYFIYLEEMQLISVISASPFEIKILEAENISGTPKKIKPEKYSDFTKTVQNILKGRMISTNEYREYFVLMEDYGFDQNALVMIINYCVNLKGDDIRLQYIKKVAVSFAEDGATTAKKVEEKLADFTASTPAIVNLLNAVGIRKQPDIDDDKLYKKWTAEMGFDDRAIIACAKNFKAKTIEKLDLSLEELFKNRKFDAKEIEDYCKNKTSIISLTIEIAKNLGIYVQNTAPYVENYVNRWYSYGFSADSLKKIAVHLFKQGKNSFEEMNLLIQKLYDGGIVADSGVDNYIDKTQAEDRLIKLILENCGYSRKIIPWDRESLAKWRSWNFSDDMLMEASKLASGKSNPLAYMNGILSAWKAEGIYSVEKLPERSASSSPSAQQKPDAGELKSKIERHYYDLRYGAEARAEAALTRATSDGVYGGIRKKLNELSIKLAFAEIRDKAQASEIARQIEELEAQGDGRLSELGISKDEFVPRYSCEICGDTGYDKSGAPCICMKKFIADLK